MMDTAVKLFDAAVRQRIRLMSDNEFKAFIAETRPSDEPRPGDQHRISK